MIKVFMVDAFTSEMFKGNPAAVCLLSSAISDTLMQAIARNIYQASQRGGILKVEVSDSRVNISGKAVTVLSGQIHV